MQRLVVLRSVLDRIDGDSFDTLEGRITFQKRVYLAQVLGLDLGYAFSWNQFGPYSSELAQDGLLLETGSLQSVRLSEQIAFTGVAESGMREFVTLADPPERLTAAAWLELLSSLHFLAVSMTGSFPLTGEVTPQVKEQLLGAKPYMTEYEGVVEAAWNRLQRAIQGRLAAA